MDLLSEVGSEKIFWLHDGGIIKSLVDLKSKLKTMPDELFSFHVNNEKNDFYNWINDVYQDHHLAKKIKLVKTRQELIDVLEFELKPKKEHFIRIKKEIEAKIAPKKIVPIKKIEVKKKEKPIIKKTIKKVAKTVPKKAKVISKHVEKTSIPGLAEIPRPKIRLFNPVGTLVSIIILFVTVALANVTKVNPITGYAVAETGSAGSGIAVIITGLFLLGTIVMLVKEKNKR